MTLNFPYHKKMSGIELLPCAIRSDNLSIPFSSLEKVKCKKEIKAETMFEYLRKSLVIYAVILFQNLLYEYNHETRTHVGLVY